MKLYGSLQNRMEENRQLCDEIKVGTGMTEYSYSDRHAYEVIAVKDQKHVTVRALDHILAGEPMTNIWELKSNENNASRELVKRGNYWYDVATVTAEEVMNKENDFEFSLWLCMHGFDLDVIKAKGSQTKYYRTNVSFGVASYYFDYEF